MGSDRSSRGRGSAGSGRKREGSGMAGNLSARATASKTVAGPGDQRAGHSPRATSSLDGPVQHAGGRAPGDDGARPARQVDPVVDPLPYLGATDLGGGGVLHQVVDRRCADPGQPGDDVADADVDVRLEPVRSDATLGSGRRSGDRRPRPRPRVAGGRPDSAPIAEDGVELGPAVGTRSGWATQVPSKPSRLTALVLADLGQRGLGHLGLAAVGDEGRHPADRVGAAPVTGLDQQLACRRA